MKFILMLISCSLIFGGCGGADNARTQHSDSNTSLRDGNNSPKSELINENNITIDSSIKFDGSSQASDSESVTVIPPSVNLVNKVQEILLSQQNLFQINSLLYTWLPREISRQCLEKRTKITFGWVARWTWKLRYVWTWMNSSNGPSVSLVKVARGKLF